jgi:hypothetical protein
MREGVHSGRNRIGWYDAVTQGGGMPRRVDFTPALLALIARQDGVIAMWQLAEHGVGWAPVRSRLTRGEWQRVLPQILVTHGGEATRRQRMIAAQLWAGPDAGIDAASACNYFGLRVKSFDPGRVDLVTPFGNPARTGGWLRVRRTISEIEVVRTPLLRYVVPPMAVLAAARSAHTEAEAIATMARALQTGLVSVTSLQAAREMMGDKWCRRVDRALVAVGVGLRSPSEKLFRDLVLSSRILPEPKWNQWLDLGDGGCPICADGLWLEAGMLHEVNGRTYHGWAEGFETTSARTERVVAADLISTQSTTQRLRREGAVVLQNLERTYQRHAGRGMPPGVTLIEPPSWAAA